MLPKDADKYSNYGKWQNLLRNFDSGSRRFNPGHSPPEIKKSTRPDLRQQRQGLALEIWRSSIPIEGAAGQKYLQNRKITY